MERTCLNCGHQFEEDLDLDASRACPACESSDTISVDGDDVIGSDGDDAISEEDLEGIDDGVWQ